MEIIVGRDQKTQKLSVSKADKPKLYGAAGSVPMDVSRKHLLLQSAGIGKWYVKNLNENNVTFVNGIAIEKKTISEQDKVELGPSRYLLPWEALQDQQEEYVSIQQLKYVWDMYQGEDIAIRNRQKTTGLLSSIPIGFTMLGGLIASAVPSIRELALIFTGIAFGIFLYGLWRRSRDDTPLELKRLQEDFDQKWICPKCRRPLNFRSYVILKQVGACPHCKVKFKE